MLVIGKSWPIPWTLAAYILRTTRSIDEAREQLERLTQREGQQEPAKVAETAWQQSNALM